MNGTTDVAPIPRDEGTAGDDAMRVADVRGALADAMAMRDQTPGRAVETGVAAIVTVESDLRFLPDTLRALFAQTVLPGLVVVVDCSGGTAEPLETSFEVAVGETATSPYASGSRTVVVQLVPAEGAGSFGEAVRRGLSGARLAPGTRSLWLLHDDSRPADAHCLEALLEAWHASPTAALIGAKQLDWDGERLHGVGAYVDGHRIATLSVDGEPDQEQYDARSDVYAVSLAGALVPVETMGRLGGIDGWCLTYRQGDDFCRRVSNGGGRVIVVPQARIAHRRARAEGLRSRTGEALETPGRRPVMALAVARQRYLVTDIAMAAWPLHWLWSLVSSFFRAAGRLAAKRPDEAWAALCLPWIALATLPGMVRARRRVARCGSPSRAQRVLLSVSREQRLQWRDRMRSFADQRVGTPLGPLARRHLRLRRARRWGLAAVMAVLALAGTAAVEWDVCRALLSGGAIGSATMPSTGASLGQLALSATTPWAFGVGVGVPAPPAPWLLVLLVPSAILGGHTAAATGLLWLAAAPLSALSFWALAGVFTRSDAVRAVSGLVWAAWGMAMGLYASVSLPMLTVMVFLPAAFAFAFRAVGLRRVEEPLRAHASVQSAALAALCFVPVVAAEPQLLLPLVVAFLAFLVFVPSHRAMLLLIPVPAALAVAPTLVNAVRYGGDGAWRQLFGDVTLPSLAQDGDPAALGLTDVLLRALCGGTADGWQAARQPWVMGALAATAAIVVVAVVSLALPFALRFSRMMWVVAVCGGVLCLAAPRVAVGFDAAEGLPVAGSPLPGLTLAMLGLMSCVCVVAGGGVSRFRELSESGAPRPRRAASTAARAGRVLLALTLVASAVVWAGHGLSPQVQGRGGPVVSSGGLPLVASDPFSTQPDRRVLALRAQGDDAVTYASMRTPRGDLIDSSPAYRAREVSGIADDRGDRTLSRMAARLLSNADDEAVAAIGRLGFAGVFVAAGGDPADRLASNLAASDGTQLVVANASGTYYRLTTATGVDPAIDPTGSQAARRSPWRIAWLVCLGVVTAAYCLVAVPVRIRAGREERYA